MSHQQPSDELEDPGITHTDADETSETRFGPRPVPEGHRRPSGPHDSRRIPPHGDVSPDGLRAYPRPSLLAKWVVWGGTGLAAAAATAGTVYAARHLADLISGRGEQPPGPPAPHPARREQASPASEPLRAVPCPNPNPARNAVPDRGAPIAV